MRRGKIIVSNTSHKITSTRKTPIVANTTRIYFSPSILESAIIRICPIPELVGTLLAAPSAEIHISRGPNIIAAAQKNPESSRRRTSRTVPRLLTVKFHSDDDFRSFEQPPVSQPFPRALSDHCQ